MSTQQHRDSEPPPPPPELLIRRDSEPPPPPPFSDDIDATTTATTTTTTTAPPPSSTTTAPSSTTTITATIATTAAVTTINESNPPKGDGTEAHLRKLLENHNASQARGLGVGVVDDEEEFAHEDIDSGDESPQTQLHMRRISNQVDVDVDLFSSSDEEDFKKMTVRKSPSRSQFAKSASVSTTTSVTSLAHTNDQSNDNKQKEEKKYCILKSNRFGRNQSRVLCVDIHNRALRFLSPDDKIRSEFPFTEITEVRRSTSSKNNSDSTQVYISFRGNRTYAIKFNTLSETDDFIELAQNIMAQNVFATPERERASTTIIHRDVYSSHSLVDPRYESERSLSMAAEEFGRPPSPSISMNHDGLAEPVPDDAVTATYLDYHVKKKNKYGIKQDRILVLNPVTRSLLLLDEKRKFKKAFAVKNIIQLEIPNSRTNKSRAYIVFAPSEDQAPFNIYFSDVFDRTHFCECLLPMGNHIIIKDSSRDTSDPHCFRFPVLKVNKMGVKKKRILYLDCKNQLVRSLNVKTAVKDTSLADGRLVKVEKSLIDRAACTVAFSDRDNWNFIFANVASCERFIVRCRAIQNGAYKNAHLSTWVDPFLEHDQDQSTPDTTPTIITRGRSNEHKSPVHISDKERVSIFVGSWNVGGCDCPKDTLENFLPTQVHDVYVVGLQECNKKDQWIQDIKTHLNNDGKSNYIPIVVKNLWEIILMVFVHQDQMYKISNIESNTVACGVGDVLGNKGAVGMSMQVQETSICFICAHLAARAERIPQRRDNYQKIIRYMRLGLPEYDVLNQFHHVVFLGDLNYRIDMKYEQVLTYIEQKQWQPLLKADQLIAERASSAAFINFKEGVLDFAPTYRMERDIDSYNNKREQAPSWTDRVLWYSLPYQNDLVLSLYSSAPAVKGSDHRPVFACFEMYHGLPYALGVETQNSVYQSCYLVLSELRLVADHVTNVSSILLRFDASFVENPTDSLNVSVSNSHLEWSWPSRVVLAPFVYDPHYLKRSHIIVSALVTDLDQAKNTFGYSVIPLKDAFNNNERFGAFRSIMTRDGAIVAILTGEISVAAHP